MARHVPIACPFPDIADHVVKTVGVGFEAADRRGAGVTILFGVVDRKDALPAIGDRLAIFIEGIAPIFIAIMAAARCKFPLRLGGKLVSEPVRIRERVLIGDIHHGMVLLSLNRRARPTGMAPVRAFHILPPLGEVAAATELRRRDKYHGARSEHVLAHSGMGFRINAPLGKGDVAGRLHEFIELGVRDLVLIDPEAIDLNDMGEAFFGPFPVRAHGEAAAWNEDHSRLVTLFGGQARVGGAELIRGF